MRNQTRHYDVVPPTVILVEDNTQLRAELAEDIRTDGFQVIELGSGTELLNYFEGLPGSYPATPPDVVVAETLLPGCSGFWACQRLHDMGSNVPVILLTSAISAEDFEDAERVGATYLLEKPLGPSRLHEALSSVIKSPSTLLD